MKHLVAALLLLVSTYVLADARILDMEQAWNRGDTLAVQQHIIDDGSKAVAGYSAEQGGKLVILDIKQVDTGVYAAAATLDDKKQVWLFTECPPPADTFWCSWGTRDSKLVGAAGASQGFDVATTAVGVGLMGAAELNPLGLAVLPLKAGALAYTHTQDYKDCVKWRKTLDMLGLGAGVANVATLVASISNPLIPIGIFAATAFFRSDSALEAARYECADMQLSST